MTNTEAKTHTRVTIQPMLIAERSIARPRIADSDYDVIVYNYDTSEVRHYVAARADVHAVAAAGSSWRTQVFVE